MSEQLVREEFALFGELMVKYRDGLKVSSQGTDAPTHGGPAGGVVPKVEEVGYTQRWYKTIVDSTGDHYKLPTDRARAKLRTLRRGISGTINPDVAVFDDLLV